MPEMWFTVRWPDGAEEICYSPSTVVAEYLASGQHYTLGEFLARVRPALQRASQRVEAKFGYRCSSADDQLAKIEASAARAQDVSPRGSLDVVVTYLGKVPP